MASIRQRGNSWTAQVRMRGINLTRSFPSKELAEAWASREEEAASGMPMLRRALKDHRLAMTLSTRFRDAVERANYTEAEIIDLSYPVKSACGIYFLIRDGTVFYVGQSRRVFNRLDRHRAEGREFDSFSFIPCPVDQLDELESVYITLLMPELNTSLPWKRRLRTGAAEAQAKGCRAGNAESFGDRATEQTSASHRCV